MPTAQRVHVDKMLSNISIGYSNEEYIADKIFKEVIVDKQSDKYYVYGKELFRQHNDLRAPGTEANEIRWTLSDDQYYAEGHALRTLITDEELQNADDVFELEKDATETVSEGILLNKEVDAASKVLDPDNYEDGLKVTLGVGQAKWSDYDNSNPQLDIVNAKTALHRTAGIRANTLILSEPVFNALLLHPKLIALFSNVERSVLTIEHLKAAFNVKDILVGSALKSGATNPGQEDVLDYIWGNGAVLAYIAPRPGKRIISLGYSFMWNKDGDGPVQVRKWYDQGRRSTVIEAERWYDQKIVSKVAGFLFADAI